MFTGDKSVFEIGKNIINKILNFPVGKAVQKVVDYKNVSFKLKFYFQQLSPLWPLQREKTKEKEGDVIEVIKSLDASMPTIPNGSQHCFLWD